MMCVCVPALANRWPSELRRDRSPQIVELQMQYCVVFLTLKLPNDIYITRELSSSGVNGSCLGSRCTLCCNSFFVTQQCINFMSQQATTGSLCRAKQCLIGFRSMATPPEACFHLLFQQHLERNGGDYIPPVVSQRFSPHRPLGIRSWQSRSTLPCCPVQLLANREPLLLPLLPRGWWYSTAETSRFKGNHDNTNQINCLPHKLRHRRDSRKKVACLQFKWFHFEVKLNSLWENFYEATIKFTFVRKQTKQARTAVIENKSGLNGGTKKVYSFKAVLELFSVISHHLPLKPRAAQPAEEECVTEQGGIISSNCTESL